MAKNNDDLADALAALAGGHVADDHDAHHGSGAEHAQEAAATPPAAPKSPAKPPAAPAAAPKAATPAKPAPARPPAAPAARPTAPAAAAPARPAVPARPAAPPAQRAAAPAPAAVPEPTPAPPPAPAARVRPAAPTRPAAPIAPNLTPPPAPEEAAPEEVVEQAPVDPEAIYDDGDAVIVPAPSPDVFKSKPKAAPKPRKPNYTQTLAFKQTIIPIMLTLGVIGLVSAGLPFVVPAGSGLAVLKEQTTSLLMFGVAGAVFLAFAGMNIMQVKTALEAEKRRK